MITWCVHLTPRTRTRQWRAPSAKTNNTTFRIIVVLSFSVFHLEQVLAAFVSAAQAFLVWFVGFCVLLVYWWCCVSFVDFPADGRWLPKPMARVQHPKTFPPRQMEMVCLQVWKCVGAWSLSSMVEELGVDRSPTREMMRRDCARGFRKGKMIKSDSTASDSKSCKSTKEWWDWNKKTQRPYHMSDVQCDCPGKKTQAGPWCFPTPLKRILIFALASWWEPGVSLSPLHTTSTTISRTTLEPPRAWGALPLHFNSEAVAVPRRTLNRTFGPETTIAADVTCLRRSQFPSRSHPPTRPKSKRAIVLSPYRPDAHTTTWYVRLPHHALVPRNPSSQADPPFRPLWPLQALGHWNEPSTSRWQPRADLAHSPNTRWLWSSTASSPCSDSHEVPSLSPVHRAETLSGEQPLQAASWPAPDGPAQASCS